MSIGLRPYQEAHVARLLSILRSRKCAHDGSSVGTGKTYCAAVVARTLGVETLVICPLSVCANWRRVMAAAGVLATVVNFESCWRKFGKVMPWGSGSFFQFSRAWPLIIIDEAHRCSADTTINSKMAIAAKRSGGYVLTLSATAASTLLKMKALGYLMDLHKLQDYRMWLFARGARESELRLKTGKVVKKIVISKDADLAAMGRLHEEIYGAGNRGSRMRVEDIAGFPQTLVEVRLLDDAPTAVTRLSDELQTYYRHRTVMGSLSQDELAKLVFYRQGSETAKIPYIMDMLVDSIEVSRCVVFCCFNQTVDTLVKEAQKRDWTVGVIRGEQTPSERQRVIDDFQANKLDLVVANIQAGGVGVSLHDPMTKKPRTAIICPSWSAIELKQAVGRVHRDSGGFSRQFIVYFGSGIEARVAASVQRKLNNLSLLNDSELDETLAAVRKDEEPSLLP